MEGKIRLIVLGVIIVAILGMYYLFYSQEVVAPIKEIDETVVTAPEQSAPIIEEVLIVHGFNKGVHTVSGNLTLPTPCYTLNADVMLSSSTPVVATLHFSSGDAGGMCIQVLDERPFEVSFKAAEDATIKGLWNGTEISLTEPAE